MKLVQYKKNYLFNTGATDGVVLLYQVISSNSANYALHVIPVAPFTNMV